MDNKVSYFKALNLIQRMRKSYSDSDIENIKIICDYENNYINKEEFIKFIDSFYETEMISEFNSRENFLQELDKSNKIKCYHFCSQEFLNELYEKGTIHANDELRPPEYTGEGYVKNYVFKVKKLNEGKGMFFAWSNPSYKGNIKFSEDGDTLLLELDVEDEYVLKTNYENWCSLGMDLLEADGVLALADEICREDYGIADGLVGSYNSIFNLKDSKMEVQILLPHLKSKWIANSKRCSKKLV